MEGIDVTEILRLRELARELDWYCKRVSAQRCLTRAGFSLVLADLARQEADEIERAYGLAPGTA